AIVRMAKVARPRMLGSAIVRMAKIARPRMLGSAIVRSPKVARPRMRASLPLLLLDDPHRDRLRRAGRLSGLSLPVDRPRIRAWRSPHFHSPIWKFARSGTLRVNTHARDPLYFHHGLLGSGGAARN